MGRLDYNIESELQHLYNEVGKHIEEGNLKVGIDKIFEYARSINKYFDEKAPWITINSDKGECINTIYNCLVAIINIANLLHPFLPFSSSKVKGWMKCEIEAWEYIDLSIENKIDEFHILFERLDKKIIEEELEKLTNI